MDVDGVKIIAPRNLPSDMAAHASQLYAKNVENLIDLLVDEGGNLHVDFGDEVVAGACITHERGVLNERAAKAAGVEPSEAPAAQPPSGGAEADATEEKTEEQTEEKTG